MKSVAIPNVQVTLREVEIWLQIAEGTKRPAIARKFGVTVKTIDFHAANLYEKIGARNMSDAIRLAITYGLIDQPKSRRRKVEVSNPSNP